MNNLTGWECNRCGTMHSPYKISCGCPMKTVTSTTMNTTLNMGIFYPESISMDKPLDYVEPVVSSFECKDENYPHCSYDENSPLVTDEEIEDAAELFLNSYGGTENRPITWGYMAYLAGCKFMRDQYEK